VQVKVSLWLNRQLGARGSGLVACGSWLAGLLPASSIIDLLVLQYYFRYGPYILDLNNTFYGVKCARSVNHYSILPQEGLRFAFPYIPLSNYSEFIEQAMP
jgi:hypothetical protein